ncbi:hypothetical protein LWI29_028418 [Acer saccharum]|uniref:Transposase (Putative), gypsy type n=1 Tax=Acer saccharum TaxID=4024 RepID=A0AA39SI09_ACESA|nr:hypothetical protein LWI29_028418 [Acer saccharum]
MSGNDTVSEPQYSWTSNDTVGKDDGVDSGTQDVNRLVTIEDPSKVVTINTRGMLEQGVVRAIAGLVEFPEYRDDVEASTSGRPLGVLDGSPASLVMEDNLHYLRTVYGIPKSVELRAPLEHERADWDIPNWTCFYEYTLRLGFRFPVPSLVRRLLKHFDIASGQLMPNSWRILMSLTILRERYRIDFGLGCVMHNYYLKEHVGDQGRYILIPRDKNNRLIIDTTTNDRQWNDTFFFDKGPQFVLRRVWNRKDIKHTDNDMSCDDTTERTKEILHIPAKDRSCRTLLVDVTSMSNAKMNLPDKADAIKRYRDDLVKKRATAQKKNQVTDKSNEDAHVAQEHIYTLSPEHHLTRKRQRKNSTTDQGKKVESSSKMKFVDVVFEPDSSMMLLSSRMSSFKEPDGFLERSNEFLLSADEEFLKGKKMEEVLQAQLHLHDRYKMVSDKCVKFKKANDTLKADKAKVDNALKELEQKYITLEKNLKGKEEERDQHLEESTKAKAVVVKQKRLVTELKEQLTSIANTTMCKAKAEIFKEYLSGEHVNWSHEEMQEVIDT